MQSTELSTPNGRMQYVSPCSSLHAFFITLRGRTNRRPKALAALISCLILSHPPQQHITGTDDRSQNTIEVVGAHSFFGAHRTFSALVVGLSAPAFENVNGNNVSYRTVHGNWYEKETLTHEHPLEHIRPEDTEECEENADP
ncbi:hypothetical protein TRVL_07254 [Trypanosoma vivax]|nr:hypothetical protein TRVL_07254 [Trypanosoma vivax]